MERIDYILENADLKDLADGTPYAEGGMLSEFMDELAEARKASAAASVTLYGGPARLLFLMRSIYFLGVLRGGEEYREQLLAVDALYDPDAEHQEFDPVPFELSESCAQLFVDDLNSLSADELTQLWASLKF